jgi:hypothetical protein
MADRCRKPQEEYIKMIEHSLVPRKDLCEARLALRLLFANMGGGAVWSCWDQAKTDATMIRCPIRFVEKNLSNNRMNSPVIGQQQ